MKTESSIFHKITTYLPMLLLAGVLLVAVGFRLYGLDWDHQMDAYPHPDERHLANTMNNVRLSWPPDWNNLADPDVSTLNPRRVNPHDPAGGRYDLAYGTLPVYLYRFVAMLFSDARDQYSGFYVVGRAVTAALSILTVLFLYLIGERLFGRRIGLLGALFLALAVTHIQLSHFMTVDVALAAFATLTLWLAVELVHRRRLILALPLGLSVGCAMACKVSGLTLGAAIAGAGVLLWVLPDDRGQRWPLGRVVLCMALAALGIVLAFGLFEFYALLDPATYLEAIGRQAEMVGGEVDWPFTRQYVNTTPYLYHLGNLFWWGLGPFLALPALAGVLAALMAFIISQARPAGGVVHRIKSWPAWFAKAPSRWGMLLLLLWVLPYFIQVGGYSVKFVRYMVPLVPTLCLLAAWAVDHAAAWLGKRAEKLPSTRWGREHLARLGPRWAMDPTTIRRVTYLLLIALVVAPTFLWAFAFSRIYSRPHTWHQASRWIYAHAPKGSVFSEEAWDDALPVNLSKEGLDRGRYQYRNITMNIYHDMPPEEKLRHIAGVLDQVDYVILSTPRLYGAVRRLPWRYPVEIRYYELLFQEQLGFELAYSATSYPSLWGHAFVDDAADESFSVYDHPKVLIYRKVRQLSEGEYRALFAGALNARPLITRVMDEPPVKLPVPEYRKPLLLDTPVAELPALGDWAWNPLANAGSLPAACFWIIALLLLTLAAWPLSAVLFAGFPDRGIMLARPIALVLVAFLAWLPASLGMWHYTAPAVWGALLATALGSWLIARWRRIDLRQIWARHRREILIGEGVFWVGFTLFLLFRIWNPDLWHPVRGGEKPMEIGFLNAILRSPSMPPYDPFFSDGYINYYYYGLFIVSTIVKLTGIHSAVAFNLILPTLAAMTIAGAFALVWALTGRRLLGTAASLFVVLVGNVAGAGPIRGRGGLGEVIEAWRKLAEPGLQESLAGVGQGLLRWIGGATLPLRTDWFWDASRAHGPYENTITEFPFFSFLFADLHPHMIGIPFGVLLLALCYSLVRSAHGRAKESVPLLVLLPVLALGLGTMAVNNSWDFPVYLLLAAGALFVAHMGNTADSLRPKKILKALLVGLTGAVLLGGIGLFAYAPFFTYFVAFVRGVGITIYPTEIQYYLGMFGLFLFPLATFLLAWAIGWVIQFFRPRAPSLQYADPVFSIRGQYLEEDDGQFDVLDETPEETVPSIAPQPGRHPFSIVGRLWRYLPLVLAILVPLIVLLVSPVLYGELNLRQMLTFVLLGELILCAVLLMLRHDLPVALRYATLAALVGLLVSLGVELVYVKDHMGGTWYRMNTIFKFYTQVWIMFGVSAAAVLGELVYRLRRSPWFVSVVWGSIFIALLAAALVYPVFGTYTRVNDRFPVMPARGTLDGRAYMQGGVYHWEGTAIFLEPDYEAIIWLEENLTGTPIVLQAAWEYYRANGVRVAYNTGFPTVLSPLHADEQRYPELKSGRERDVFRIYNSVDPEETLALLNQYRVDYVYIGPFEYAAYSPAGLETFRYMAGNSLDLVYDSGEVQIYALRPEYRTHSPESGTPMAVPTVSPAQVTRGIETEIRRLRQLADANPGDAGLQFELGNRLRQIGRLDDAVEVFRRSLQHTPDDVAMHHTLGDTYLEAGQMEDAFANYYAAIAVDPDSPAAYNKLGMVLAEQGRYLEAAEAFVKAIEVAPEFSEAYFHLGETYERMDRMDDALEIYMRLIQQDPDSLWAEKAGDRLLMLSQPH